MSLPPSQLPQLDPAASLNHSVFGAFVTQFLQRNESAKNQLVTGGGEPTVVLDNLFTHVVGDLTIAMRTAEEAAGYGGGGFPMMNTSTTPRTNDQFRGQRRNYGGLGLLSAVPQRTSAFSSLKNSFTFKNPPIKKDDNESMEVEYITIGDSDDDGEDAVPNMIQKNLEILDTKDLSPQEVLSMQKPGTSSGTSGSGSSDGARVSSGSAKGSVGNAHRRTGSSGSIGTGNGSIGGTRGSSGSTNGSLSQQKPGTSSGTTATTSSGSTGDARGAAGSTSGSTGPTPGIFDYPPDINRIRATLAQVHRQIIEHNKATGTVEYHPGITREDIIKLKELERAQQEAEEEEESDEDSDEELETKQPQRARLWIPKPQQQVTTFVNNHNQQQLVPPESSGSTSPSNVAITKNRTTRNSGGIGYISPPSMDRSSGGPSSTNRSSVPSSMSRSRSGPSSTNRSRSGPSSMNRSSGGPSSMNGSMNRLVLTLHLDCTEVGCGRKYATLQQWEEHLMVEHGVDVYLCQKCGYSFTEQHLLTTHCTSTHPNESVWSCDVCPNEYPTYTRLLQHSLGQHQSGGFMCSFKGCAFTGKKRADVFLHYSQSHNATEQAKQLLQQQQQKELEEEDAEDLDMDDEESMDTDEEEEEGEVRPRHRHRPHLSQTQRYNAWLARSKQGHGPLVCAQCGKHFPAKFKLTQHLRTVHSDAKPFKCIWEGCNFRSKYRSNTLEHIKARHLKPLGHVGKSKNMAIQPQTYLEIDEEGGEE